MASNDIRLMFADDLLVFYHANLQESRAVDECIFAYCRWSGQKLNKAKSSIYLSPNTHTKVAAALCPDLNLKLMIRDCKYLGLPLFLGRDKSQHFDMLKGRVVSKLLGWKCNTLSQSSRTTLIKSVATALPQYYMQTLKLPSGWCKTVDRLLKDFWWGFPAHKSHNYTPKAWTVICQPKIHGGLRIRKMEYVNSTFLQKLGWNLLSHPTAVWALILKSKYFPSSSFLDSLSKQGSSLIWQGLSKIRDLLKSTVCYIPRHGQSLYIRSAPWIPLNDGLRPCWLPSTSEICPLQFVSELVDADSGAWNLPLLLSLFTSPTVDNILALPPPHSQAHDSLIWTPNSHSIFSVKEAIALAQDGRLSTQPFLSEQD